MSKLVCAVEAWADAQPGVEKLIHGHWEEVALYKDDVPLDPNWDAYEQMDKAKGLVAVTARHNGELVGYALFFVAPHPHYKSTLCAMNDVLYLHPAYRRGSAGVQLIKAADRILRERGDIRRISWHVKVQHDFGAILKRLGYAPEEAVWGRYVGEK